MGDGDVLRVTEELDRIVCKKLEKVGFHVKMLASVFPYDGRAVIQALATVCIVDRALTVIGISEFRDELISVSADRNGNGSVADKAGADLNGVDQLDLKIPTASVGDDRSCFMGNVGILFRKAKG